MKTRTAILEPQSRQADTFQLPKERRGEGRRGLTCTQLVKKYFWERDGNF